MTRPSSEFVISFLKDLSLEIRKRATATQKFDKQFTTMLSSQKWIEHNTTKDFSEEPMVLLF